MALTDPHMGLRIWNLPTDLFDHDQLADNFAKLGLHDHTLGRGVQIPTDGIADGAITSTKLATTLDPGPAYTTYKTVRSVGGGAVSGQAVGATLMLHPWFTSSGASTFPGAAVSSTYAFYLNPADFAVPGRTTVFRLRFSAITNAVAPLTTYNIGLYPIATWGGTSGSTPFIATLGGAVAGSTASIVAPAAGGPSSPALSSDFSTAAGWYAIAVNLTNVSQAANAVTTFISSFQVRQV